MEDVVEVVVEGEAGLAGLGSRVKAEKIWALLVPLSDPLNKKLESLHVHPHGSSLSQRLFGF